MSYIGQKPANKLVTSSDMEDDIVTSAKIVDATIATADVADDAITLAKMASGTDGNIISYDASGNPVAVATGTDGQVLTSTGAGSPPAFEDAGGGANTPIFYGELASAQTLTRDTITKITGLTNDEVDSNTAFDGTTFTVPSGQGGTYFLYASIQSDFQSVGDDGQLIKCYLYKNGSELKEARFNVQAGSSNVRFVALSVSITATLSATDTIELYTLLNDFSGGSAIVLANATSIGGYKLIT